MRIFSLCAALAVGFSALTCAQPINKRADVGTDFSSLRQKTIEAAKGLPNLSILTGATDEEVNIEKLIASAIAKSLQMLVQKPAECLKSATDTSEAVGDEGVGGDVRCFESLEPELLKSVKMNLVEIQSAIKGITSSGKDLIAPFRQFIAVYKELWNILEKALIHDQDKLIALIPQFMVEFSDLVFDVAQILASKLQSTASTELDDTIAAYSMAIGV